MIGFGNWIKSLGFVAILLAVTTAAVALGFVRSSITDIRNHWQQNLLWPSSQLEIEYLRFREVLIRFAEADPRVDQREVNKRFDILWSRVNLFHQGDPGGRITGLPIAKQTISSFQQTLLEQEPIVVSLKKGETDKAKRILAVFESYETALRQFNRRVMRGEVAYGYDLRDGLSVNQRLLTWLGAGAVLLSLVLLAYFASESRRQGRIALENIKLLERARSGSRAKTAFLSMMSHDLRTPMNGILGMIALARRQGGMAQQNDMLEQAADSSEQMSNLLTDILEFAALGEADPEPAPDPFFLEELSWDIMTELALSARREELKFSITMDEDCPIILLGDKRRLRQITVHLAQFLARNSAQKTVLVHLNYEQGFIKIQLAFCFDPETENWHPERVLGPSIKQDTGFTNDALGPAIARGFTENMGGELSLTMPKPGQDTGQVILTVPLQAREAANVSVRIVTQSSAMAAICKGAVGSRYVTFVESDNSGSADTVIIEAGSDFEAVTYAEMRKLHPTAEFVALGTPKDQTLFDGQINLPIDIDALRNAPFLQPKSC